MPDKLSVGVLLTWIIKGQVPTALTEFSSRLSFLSSLGDGPIETEILSQRAVKPKTATQPTLSSNVFPIRKFFLINTLIVQL